VGTLFFQMWEPHRRSLIKAHSFYFSQAMTRLLGQFENIDEESNQENDRWLAEQASFFDPERDDPSDHFQSAYDASIEFHQMLWEMRETTQLSIVAGIYHRWDKQLRDWLVKEARHAIGHTEVAKAIWRADFPATMDLMESMGYQVHNSAFFGKLDACRLVVNVYKHGPGISLTELKRNYPQYLSHAFQTDLPTDVERMGYTNLRVTDDHLREFSDAIIEFWMRMPQEVSELVNAPEWLVKAHEKDLASTRRSLELRQTEGHHF